MPSFEISLTGKRDYAAVYADIFDHFGDEDGRGEFTGSYGKPTYRYRISFETLPGGVSLGLDYIAYNAEWEPSYRRVIDICKLEGVDQTVVLPEEPIVGIPHEAHHTPEAVLRSILTTAQVLAAPQWQQEQAGQQRG